MRNRYIHDIYAIILICIITCLGLAIIHLQLTSANDIKKTEFKIKIVSSKYGKDTIITKEVPITEAQFNKMFNR